MFNASKVANGLAAVENCDQLIALLGDSVAYTFGDKFVLGNYKVGHSGLQPDDQHPDWAWTPITGQLVGLTVCRVPDGSHYLFFTTGYRNGDRTKSVLAMYATLASLRNALVDKLSVTEGNSTIGTELAHKLGYTDWVVINPSSGGADKHVTRVYIDTTGVQTAVNTWVSYIMLDFPDDGEHTYSPEYDPYSGLMLYDGAVPTMMCYSYNPGLLTGDLVLCQSTYEADCQNTTDIVHAALDNFAKNLGSRVGDVADDVDGLITANGAIYAAIAQMPVFGNKFVDVVTAMKLIEAAGQYIPRP